MKKTDQLRCLFVIDGAFGQDLFKYRARPYDRSLSSEHLAFGDYTDIDVLFVLHSNADTQLRDHIEKIGFDKGIPSVGLQLLPNRLICGPVVVPGITACWQCFRKRSDQHAGSLHPYDIDIAVTGLDEGYGPQHLAVASGLVSLALAEISTIISKSNPSVHNGSEASVGGTVRSFDMVSGALSSASTVATNRCTRCGFRFDALRKASNSIFLELFKPKQ